MTSGLGFGQVGLFQSRPKVKGACFPSILSISLSISSHTAPSITSPSFIASIHSYSLLHPTIIPLTQQFPLFPLNFIPLSIHLLGLILSSSALFSTHPSHHPFSHPYTYRSFSPSSPAFPSVHSCVSLLLERSTGHR